MATAIGTYATTASMKSRAGITDATDDTLIGTICDQVNALLEFLTGRVLAPIASAVYLFDGTGRRRLYVPNGVRAVSLLEIAPTTGGTFATVPAADYVLRPIDKHANDPYAWIEFVDIVTGSNSFFPYGYANVRSTMTTGPAAIPDDVVDIALTTAVRAWHGRQEGQADVIGSDENGEPIVSRFMSGRDREVLRGYRSRRKFGV